MKLIPMDPSLAASLSEGHGDLLAKEEAVDDRFVKHARCPACGGDRMTKEANPHRPFRRGKLLPDFLMRCGDCDRLISSDGLLIVADDAAWRNYGVVGGDR